MIQKKKEIVILILSLFSFILVFYVAFIKIKFSKTKPEAIFLKEIETEELKNYQVLKKRENFSENLSIPKDIVSIKFNYC